MSLPAPSIPPIIESVLHPTDFSEASRVAVAHALKAAINARSKLTLLHVAAGGAAGESDDFPHVRETLERWGLLPPGSPRSAVAKLGMEVSKVVGRDHDPVRSVVHFLAEHLTELVVLATHHHEGRVRWFQKSVAEPIARQSGQMTLFVPEGVKGFVSLDDGSVSLTSVLIPVADTPRAQPAATAAVRLVRQLKLASGVFTLLHVGDGGPIADVYRPDVPGWTWNVVTRTGNVIDSVLETAAETHAGLIAMTTNGRHGFLDALRGSHSERVLRRATSPVLAIPESSLATEAMRV